MDGCFYTSGDITLIKVPRTEVSFLPAPTGKCEGDSIILSPLNYKDGSIRWSTGATSLNISVGKTGKYTVTVTSKDGICKSTANTNVVFTPAPKVNITAPSRLCFTPLPTQLIASPSGGTWAGSNVNAAGVFTVKAIGVYEVRYEVTQSGCKGKDRKEITILDAPVFDLGADRSLCRGNTDFIGVSTPQTGVNYRWSTGENTPTIFPERTGKYTLTATKGICRVFDEITVTILPTPFVNLRDEVPLCVPSTLPVRLDAGGGVGLSYLWNPGGQKTRQISVNNIGNYSVKVTNSSNCSTTAQTKVIDRCDPSILVPEIITPNDDNLNDSFQVFPFYIKEYDLKIFNRWGELIFTSKSPEDRWDGKYKGILVKPDSFAWVITYIPEYFPEQGLKRKEGAVVVVW